MILIKEFLLFFTFHFFFLLFYITYSYQFLTNNIYKCKQSKNNKLKPKTQVKTLS